MDDEESELSDYPGETMDGGEGEEQQSGTDEVSPTQESPDRDSDLEHTQT